MEKCKRTILHDNGLSRFYVDCDRECKFIVKYRLYNSQVIQTEKLCGIHRNSVKKWADRLNKKYNTDVLYNEEKI